MKAIPVALAAVTALALAGCGSNTAEPSSTTTATSMSTPAASSSASSPEMMSSQPVEGAHNAADAMFAQMMIVHHQGALDMSTLAPTRAGSDEVKALATRIEKAQQPEIDQMTSWLRSWNEPLESGHGAHDMPGMDINGQTQEEVNKKLAGLKGTDFDRYYLESMIAHHEGALVMAKDEIAKGESPDAKKLSEQIVSSQAAEIAEMKKMLAAL